MIKQSVCKFIYIQQKDILFVRIPNCEKSAKAWLDSYDLTGIV